MNDVLMVVAIILFISCFFDIIADLLWNIFTFKSASFSEGITTLKDNRPQISITTSSNHITQ